ncbi:MAG: hypothetical protein K0R18_1073 [Bacillales bacterium]|jgi:thiazole/oxazole-forming peptide maturase SagD family component|nr:hypothetical protein [Bacillales bacterium]
MKTLKFTNKIDWVMVDVFLQHEDVWLCLPEDYLVIRKNIDFATQLNYTLQVFKNIKVNHWIVYLYNAVFSSLKENAFLSSEEAKQFAKCIAIKYDITLISRDGKLVDGLNFIKDRFTDTYDKIDFSVIIQTGNTLLPEGKKFRKLTVEDAAKGAQRYLNNRVIGRHFLDTASTPIVGVGYEYKTDRNYRRSYGYGRAWNFKTAKQLADIEAVERYVSQFYAFEYNEISAKGSYRKLEDVSIEPQNFYLEKKTHLTKDTELYWTKAQSIKTGKWVYIPEDLVYYSNDFYRQNYLRAINDSSNGVALGGSYPEAMIGGLIELIERHSFLAMWYGGIPRKQIINYSQFISQEMKEAINKLIEKQLNIDLFEISFFKGVYVVWALIRNFNSEATMFSYSAAGAGFELGEAIEAALLETIVGFSVQSNVHKKMPHDISRIVSLDDHVERYGDSSNQHSFDFINGFDKVVYKRENASYRKHFNSQEDIVRFLYRILLAELDDIYFANLTSKELRSFNLYAVKAIVPGMFPMTFGEDSQRVNLKQINLMRRENGLPPINKLRKDPHPFP